MVAGRAQRVVRRQLRALQEKRRDPEGLELAQRVRAQNLTYLDVPALLDLRARVQDAEAKGLAGAIVEAGCALGGSAIVLGATKAPSRPMYVYDVFGTIPPPSERDGDDVRERYDVIAAGEAVGVGGATYYGYLPELKQRVADSFAEFDVEVGSHDVHLVEGLFEDTIHLDEPVAVAHVDGDWYDSVAVCLARLWPVLVPGGVIVIDDYDAWSGCRRAVDDFLAVTDDCSTEKKSRVHLVKRG